MPCPRGMWGCGGGGGGAWYGRWGVLHPVSRAISLGPVAHCTSGRAVRVLLKGVGGGGPGSQKSKSLCTKTSQIHVSVCKFHVFPP